MNMKRIILSSALVLMTAVSTVPVNAQQSITDLQWATNNTDVQLDDTLTFTAPEGYRNKIFTPGANKYYYQLVETSATEKDVNGSLNNITNLAGSQGTLDPSTNLVTINLSKIKGFGTKKSYKYIVRIGEYNNGFQVIASSNEVTLTYGLHEPAVPANIKQGTDPEYVSWDVVDGASFYQIEHYDKNGKLIEKVTNGKNYMLFDDEVQETKGLSGGDVLKVTAVNGAGTSAAAEYTVQKYEMYRLYNPNSGEHFYTMNSEERDSLKSVGWKYEGVGWIAPTTGDPVYRLYNPIGGEHHYTLEASERDMLVGAGWNYEGIGWSSDPNKTIPVYRQYNPNAFSCNHNFTTSKDENDYLVRVGWNPEGISWYALG